MIFDELIQVHFETINSHHSYKKINLSKSFLIKSESIKDFLLLKNSILFSTFTFSYQ